MGSGDAFAIILNQSFVALTVDFPIRKILEVRNSKLRGSGGSSHPRRLFQCKLRAGVYKLQDWDFSNFFLRVGFFPSLSLFLFSSHLVLLPVFLYLLFSLPPPSLSISLSHTYTYTLTLSLSHSHSLSLSRIRKPVERCGAWLEYPRLELVQFLPWFCGLEVWFSRISLSFYLQHLQTPISK